jgi:subtilisin family serine protease
VKRSFLWIIIVSVLSCLSFEALGQPNLNLRSLKKKKKKYSFRIDTAFHASFGPVYITHSIQDSSSYNKQSWTPAEKKMQSSLIALKNQFLVNGSSFSLHGVGLVPNDSLQSDVLADTQGRVYIYINVNTKINRNRKFFINDIKNRLASLSINPTDIDSLSLSMQAWVPVNLLDTLASLPFIKSLEVITPAIQLGCGHVHPLAGERIRSDVSKTLWSNANGHGISVGVLSDDCGESEYLLESRFLSGELPFVSALDDDYRGIRTHEGLAMMEIIAGIAHSSGLLFATGQGGIIRFANNIRRLANSGCRIITDDIFYPQEPAFSQGDYIGSVINYAVGSKNVVYIAAAGNFAKEVYSFQFNPTGGASTFGGCIGSPTHLFSSVSTDPSFVDDIVLTPGKHVTVALYWDDPDDDVQNDFDLYLVDRNSTVNVSQTNSASDNPITGAVREVLDYINTTGSTITLHPLIVQCTSSTVNPTPRMKLWVHFPDLSCDADLIRISKNGSIIGHARRNDVVTVGAIGAVNWNYNQIECFSSLGPVENIDYSLPISGGSRPLISNSPIKPDVCSLDQVYTDAPSITGRDWSRFSGTSAAAPSVAGLAAQIMSAFSPTPKPKPSYMPVSAYKHYATNLLHPASVIRDILRRGCIPYGISPGIDNAFGAGRIDAFRSLALADAEYSNSSYALSKAINRPSITAFMQIPSSLAPDVNQQNSITISASPNLNTIHHIAVSVTLDGTHANDYTITLTPPSGVPITLMNTRRLNDRNPNIIFYESASSSIGSYTDCVPPLEAPPGEMFGVFTPSGSFSSLSGVSPVGTYTLTVTSSNPATAFTLKDWGVFIW